MEFFLLVLLGTGRPRIFSPYVRQVRQAMLSQTVQNSEQVRG